VYYQPARPIPNGGALLALSPLEFLDTLSRLIPPPRVHRHRYHGVQAPNARLRARVVALGRDDATESEGGSPEGPGTEEAADGHDDPAVSLTAAARSRWAQVLARIYEVFPLRCPECGSDMRILAFVTDPEPTRAILRHLDLPHAPPRLSPARGPPQPAFDLDTDPVAPVEQPIPANDFDQTPVFDPVDPEPVPASTSTRPAEGERRTTPRSSPRHPMPGSKAPDPTRSTASSAPGIPTPVDAPRPV
jgi:hypothetical protein